MEVPETFAAVVREAILGMYASKLHVTPNTLLQKLQSAADTDTASWTWSRTTLHHFLTSQMNYSYGTKGSYYRELKEDAAIAAQLIVYIKQMKKSRAKGRRVFYQDETWVNKNMTPAMVWLDADSKGDVKAPQRKGERFFICHIGGSSGFVHGARLIFRGSKSLKDSDYHAEMNSDVFMKWIARKVFPAVPARSVIVLDRATYHMKLAEGSQPAKAAFRKEQFAQWLAARGVVWEAQTTIEQLMELTRIELAEACKKNEPPPVFLASELARKWNCEVLFLPVGHPELGPIEMVWGYIKDYIIARNVNFSLGEVEKFAYEALGSIDDASWDNYVAHCIKIEDKYFAAVDYTPITMNG